MLGRGLIGVAQADPAGVIVCHDHKFLQRPVLLAQGAGDRHKVACGIRDGAGSAGHLVNGGGSGEAFRNVKRARIVHCADNPKAAARLPARMVELAAIPIDVLE